VAVAFALCVWLSATAVPSGAQDGTAGGWTPPRTPDGRPDLQGVWANNDATPLERPAEFADRAVLSDEELADLERRVAAVLDGGDALFGDDLIRAALAGGTEFRSFDRDTGNYDQQWLVERPVDRRTSLIIDPPDGRVPPLTPEAVARARTRAADRAAHPADGPEDRTLSERCISYGQPNLLAGYNSYYQILQAPGYAVVVTEMIHDTRIVPLDGRPHVGPAIRSWHGDSRGRWDGDTLVVDTTNFPAEGSFRGATDRLHLVERFTRVDPDTMHYDITIADPATWTRPWTLRLCLHRTDEPLLEYACHEGNLSIEGVLSGYRAEEARGREP
jgi:hypothetical protein